MVTGCTGYVICYNDVMHVCMTTRKHMHVHIFDAKAGHLFTYVCCFAMTPDQWMQLASLTNIK